MGTTDGQPSTPVKSPHAVRFHFGLRIAAGTSLIALFLFAASRTTRDCTVGLYVYDICAWVWVREHLGLPASKLLRAIFLELIGLTLTLGIFLTVRFVLPFPRSGNRAKTGREDS